MQPYQGGNMIADVTFERIIYQDSPNRFEAGTGNIADAVGLGAAIDYVERIGMERIALRTRSVGLRHLRFAQYYRRAFNWGCRQQSERCIICIRRLKNRRSWR